MYARTYRKAEQERRFSITDRGPAGWEVKDVQDSHIVRCVVYDDWHRVERARMTFAQEGMKLKDDGWKEC